MPNITAMLFALTSPHPSLNLEDFNAWYDTRYALFCAASPSLHAISRFQAVSEVSA